MSSPDQSQQLVDAIKQGGFKEAIRITQQNPELASALSKMVRSNIYGMFDLSKDNPQTSLNSSQMTAISEGTKGRISDNENIAEIFPDLERAKQIMISSILSPKDMVNSDLIYRLETEFIPPDITSKIIEIVKSEMDGHYKISDKLESILQYSMFTDGSYVTCVLPENILDDIINGKSKVTQESMSAVFNNNGNSRNLGFLGSPDESKSNSSALEAFQTNRSSYDPNIKCLDGDKEISLGIEVTDNFHLLKVPEVIKVNREVAVKAAIKGKLDNLKPSTESNYDAFYKSQSGVARNFLSIDPSNVSRKSVGRPLVIRLPAESVIPIHVPGDETSHIGYFVLIDIDGNPVSTKSTPDSMQGLAGGVNDLTSNGNSVSSALLNKARSNLHKNDGTEIALDQQARIYANIVERNLKNRLKNGLIGDNFEIGGNEELYQVMLTRSLSNTFTRLLFVPGELVTYFAFKYYKNGVGKSYLDDLKIITGLRAILLFAKVTGAAKNAIAVTHVDMTLDPNDPDPVKTIAKAQNEVLKMRQQYIPLGINTAVDLTDWVTRAGFEWTFQGHPKLPNTKFEFESKQLQHNLPDDALEENLRKQSYMYFGLAPEIVDNGFNAEFATSVVTNNILLSRIVIQLQNKFNVFLAKHIRNIVAYDKVIIQKLKEVILAQKETLVANLPDDQRVSFNENSTIFIDNLIDTIIQQICVDLPKPDITTLQNQSQAFKDHEEALEAALAYWISPEMLPQDLAGDVNTHIEAIRAIVKAFYMRKWMADNGYFTELSDLTNTPSDGIDSFDIVDVENLNKSYMEKIIRNCIGMIKSMEAIKKAANKDLSNMNIDEGGGSSFGSDDSDTGTGDTGGDDFGMSGGDDFSLDETPAEPSAAGEPAADANTDKEPEKTDSASDSGEPV